MTSNDVLEIFKKITTIPRESGHEEQMVAWLQSWAEENSFEFKKDAVGNVCISKPASKGKEKIPVIVLQAHQDMVCEKLPSSDHDFTSDPVSYVIEDGWMVAHDTTLGADDGIGIAAALALLLDPTPKGRVECLFTISEETDMNGAENLQAGFISGKTLINLDSEDEGQIFIGCSGGLNTRIEFNLEFAAPSSGLKAVELRIENGIGGHSGDDINKDRMNTLQQLCRFLYHEQSFGLGLCSICGGGKANAIARDAKAVILVRDSEATAERFARFGQTIHQEFHNTDPDVICRCDGTETPVKVIASRQATAILSALYACPHGMQAMSQDVPGLVQTSTNLAAVRMSDDKLEVITSQRSPAPSERHMIADKVAAVFELAGAKTEKLLEYPGWEPNPESPILKRCVESYRKLFGTDPEIKAIHAGLECGMFLTKFPELDMISFGPTLRGVHAPGEKLKLASLDKFNALLEDLVNNFE